MLKISKCGHLTLTFAVNNNRNYVRSYKEYSLCERPHFLSLTALIVTISTKNVQKLICYVALSTLILTGIMRRPTRSVPNLPKIHTLFSLQGEKFWNDNVLLGRCDLFLDRYTATPFQNNACEQYISSIQFGNN